MSSDLLLKIALPPRRIVHSISIGAFCDRTVGPQGTLPGRAVAGEILDAHTNTQGISETIAKSRWMELLSEWGYSPSRRDADKELSKTIEEDLPLYSECMKCTHFRGERPGERQRGRKASDAPSP